MSQQDHWYNEGAPPTDAPVEPPPGANALGIAGFVVGCIGLCGTSGLLSPVGLVLSVIGLFRRPRGWAVAGTIVSALGCCCLFPMGLTMLLLVTGVMSVSAFTIWVGNVTNMGPTGKTIFHASVIATMIGIYVSRHGALPDSLGDLDLEAPVLADGWGHPFIYEIGEDERFTLVAPGSDGATGTGDDIAFDGAIRNGRLDFMAQPRKPRGGAASASGGSATGSSGADADGDAPPDAGAAPAGTP